MPYMAGIFLLLAAVFVVASIVLYIFARQASFEVPVLEERLANYRSHEIQKPIELPPHDKLVVLRTRVRELNDLSNTNGPPLPLLLSRLENLIPDRVWLVSIQYRSRENDTKLVAEADHAELLTEFMEQLERSGYFSQVLLTRQSQRSEDKQRSIQFEIQLRGKS